MPHQYYWPRDNQWHDKPEPKEIFMSPWPHRPLGSRTDIINAFDRNGPKITVAPPPPPAPTASMDYAKNVIATTDNNGIHSLYVDFGTGALKIALTLAHAETIARTFVGTLAVSHLSAEAKKRGYELKPITPPLPGRPYGPKSRLLTSGDSWWRICAYESSAIDKSAFNPRTRELYILFKGKPNEAPRIHRYVEVTDTDAQYLERAGSAGSVYNQRIKGKYPSISATTFPSGTGIREL